jgi:predicted NBD/HSP70 family sugar kinase
MIAPGTLSELPPMQETAGHRDVVGRANAASILMAVLQHGPLARSEIADLVGLTRPTVTRVSNRLIQVGLMKVGLPRKESSGRPLVPLALDGDDRAVITVHLGASESRLGIVDLQGRVITEERASYPSFSPQDVSADIARRITRLADATKQRRILGVGASIGGWVEPEQGVVVGFDPMNWREVPLRSLLANQIGLPIAFDQFIRGLALAERMFGAARGRDDFLEVWFGNVVGAALVQNGRVHRGPRGASGLITHFPVRQREHGVCVCGRTGCLVQSVSDGTVISEARALSTDADSIDIREVVLRAEKNKDIRDLVARVARIAGEAAGAMADLVDPMVLVVAGTITTASIFEAEFRSALEATAELGDQLVVRVSQFGDLAPTVASAAVFLDKYYADPMSFEADDQRVPLVRMVSAGVRNS